MEDGIRLVLKVEIDSTHIQLLAMYSMLLDGYPQLVDMSAMYPSETLPVLPP